MGQKRKKCHSSITTFSHQPLKKKQNLNKIQFIEEWAKGDGKCLDLTPYLNIEQWEDWHRRKKLEPFNIKNLSYIPH